MNRYQRINNLFGFILFTIALIVYWKTMEPTVSFWDCGEFLSASNKLEVGHQPGAPLFLMIAKLFSLLAIGDTARIAYWTNFGSVVASAATIMFLFWTITAMASKVFLREKTTSGIWSVIGAGIIGALAFTFSDTFWFSAVESEVYALSTLCTAITFWAILKWEKGKGDRWLVFISLMIGLSIGVHLLSLLTIPAVVLVWYFKKAPTINWKGVLKAFIAGCLIVGIVQFFLVQYLVLFAAKFDLFFVNTLGTGFGAGALFFMLLIVSTLSAGIFYSVKREKYYLNLALICLTCILIGYSSYLLIIIRANAKPTINLSDPDNAFSLYDYLGRTNYGETPLVYGQTFDAKVLENKETGLTYRRGKNQYEVSGKTYKTVYDQNELFPRMYSHRADHIRFYQKWLNLEEGEHPSFTKNIRFFTSYQVGFMYWRYFLWNFAGRQNDIQGQGGPQNGNWISGIKPLDQMRIGNQHQLPASITKNEGHHVFYGLPLILGLIGMAWLFRKSKSISLVIAVLFFFTGLAIIIYLNQDPLQVRERDYAYVGSFYAFAIWIGFGFLAVKEFLSKFTAPKLSFVLTSCACIIVPMLMGTQGWGDHDRSNKTTALTMAKNYLNSCAKNAILFTNADNDTFPLWYAQEVEGIRTDVRVVNFQYLSDASYINQMKKPLRESEGLPISMNESKYVTGVRDVLPYIDYGLKDSVELGDLFSVLTSDQKADQVEMNDGTYSNFMPARKLKLTVNKEEVLHTNTVSEGDRNKITDLMEWEFNKKYALKSDLAIIDILVHNHWKRPVYFATSISSDTYSGLDKYLYLEGYAYRLLPYKTDQIEKEQRTNSKVMYTNIMKMDFSNFKKANYLDPESRRFLSQSWDLNNTLVGNLAADGQTKEAFLVMKKSLKELPTRCYSIRDSLTNFYTIRNLYSVNDVVAANQLSRETADFLSNELSYIVSLEPKYQSAYIEDAQLGLSVLNELEKMTAEVKQVAENTRIKQQLNKLQEKFSKV